MMQDKVARSEVMVALEAGRHIGLLRYSLYCDWIPFIIFLFVLEDHRRTGVGSQLATFFERQMRRSRFKLAMVSSASAGTSQHFWRKMGYHDAGCLCVPHESFEILFAKEL
jgi:GNAT superfamily N-acetyltransferase